MIRRVTPLFALAALLGGCAGSPEPVIRTVEVVRPVPAPCVPGNLPAPPIYPDSDATLRAAPDAATRYALIAAGRLIRIARLDQLEPVIQGCPRQ